MRLSPLDSEMFRMQTGVTLAHLIARRFDAASSWAAKAFRNVPILVLPGAVIAASYALAGRMDEALRAMQHLRKLNPALRLASLEKWLPFHDGKISRRSRKAYEERGAGMTILAHSGRISTRGRGGIDPRDRCRANGSFPRSLSRKPPVRLRPDRAHPRRSHCLMLRSKTDVRSGSGLRLLESA
jgi:hypothetical protein